MSVWWDFGGHLSCCRQASGLVCLCLILFLVHLLKTLHSREESKDSFCLFSRILPLTGDKAMLVCLCQSIYIKTHVMSLCIHFSYTVCWRTSISSCSNDLPVHKMHTFLLPTCDMLSVGSQSWWGVLSTTPCSHPMCVCINWACENETSSTLYRFVHEYVSAWDYNAHILLWLVHDSLTQGIFHDCMQGSSKPLFSCWGGMHCLQNLLPMLQLPMQFNK